MVQLKDMTDYYIKTERLFLRQFDTNDINEIYLSALNDNDVVGLTEARYKSWDRKNVEDYIKDTNESGDATLIGIFININKKPIGNIRLFNIHYVHKRAELGIMLYDKSQWGYGYGLEALKAVCDFAFYKIGLHRIVADYYNENIPSSKIFEKAGFTVEGIFKDHFFYNGKYTDSIRVGLINPKGK